MRALAPITILIGALLAARLDISLSRGNSANPSAENETSIATVAANAPQTTGTNTYIFPLKSSTNKRYLVDQADKPFLMVGDSPQTIIANASVAEATRYMANRQQYGINTLWVNLLCSFAESCNPAATTFDGLAPFLSDGDLSKPNPAYFQRVDDLVGLASSFGMVVLLDPIETSSWLPALRANGVERAFPYGQY